MTGNSNDSGYEEKLAAERNGRTKVPNDPGERKRWAHEMAIQQGWLPATREPGDEGQEKQEERTP